MALILRFDHIFIICCGFLESTGPDWDKNLNNQDLMKILDYKAVVFFPGVKEKVQRKEMAADWLKRYIS